MNDDVASRFQKLFKNADVILGFSIIGVIMLMVVPLAPWALDFFLVLSLTAALGILLLSIYTRKPLDFSIFPTILLITTLMRLGLNVASTRLILSEGHRGTGAAGVLIESFADYLVGGNYVVGFILFVIFIIINFMVITKGSGRISEVAARFTLDAMPGKQMAIDADLNAGMINDTEAKRRRKEIESEADFYGAMDGASKFVRGDAVAGILITVINIVGGLIIGTMQKGLEAATAAKYYTLLTVGDGLVSQVPALVISVAAGLVVTRATSGESLSQEASKQLFFNEKVFFILSGSLFGMGIILSGAFVPFFVLSVITLGLGLAVKRFKEQQEKSVAASSSAKALDQKDRSVEPTGAVETLQLEVGYGLISIVDSSQKGDLLDRIQSLRKQFAQDLGIVVPSMSIRDNLQLKPGEYVVMVRGVEVGHGELLVDHFLAMDPGGVSDVVEGIPTKEPVFNLDAVWIHEIIRKWRSSRATPWWIYQQSLRRTLQRLSKTMLTN